ncbi:hypothetical protein PAPYR_11859 [Paratrimastix pyriformis]|uniref:Uncharacterized protein n=1 Tax=Paratrimastix pyriformis TaxID=342808 RepID=A0ABQ8U4K7_9EUKA|nr:hypothetical protein PAPYR_11859 [Paratrimastix pyriformis]
MIDLAATFVFEARAAALLEDRLQGQERIKILRIGFARSRGIPRVSQQGELIERHPLTPDLLEHVVRFTATPPAGVICPKAQRLSPTAPPRATSPAPAPRSPSPTYQYYLGEFTTSLDLITEKIKKIALYTRELLQLKSLPPTAPCFATPRSQSVPPQDTTEHPASSSPAPSSTNSSPVPSPTPFFPPVSCVSPTCSPVPSSDLIAGLVLAIPEHDIALARFKNMVRTSADYFGLADYLDNGKFQVVFVRRKSVGAGPVPRSDVVLEGEILESHEVMCRKFELVDVSLLEP